LHRQDRLGGVGEEAGAGAPRGRAVRRDVAGAGAAMSAPAWLCSACQERYACPGFDLCLWCGLARVGGAPPEATSSGSLSDLLPAIITSRTRIVSSGCWIYQGVEAGTSESAHTTISINGRQVGVHRYVYELLVGPIPEGLVADHVCETRRCIN